MLIESGLALSVCLSGYLGYRVHRLQALVNRCMVCPSYKVFTRQALDLKWDKLSSEDNAVIFFDLDNIHKLNEDIGYLAVDARIAACFTKMRKTEHVFRLMSGDELVIILPSADAAMCAERIRQVLIENELSATFSIVSIPRQRDMMNCIDVASNMVIASKKRGERGIIIDGRV